MKLTAVILFFLLPATGSGQKIDFDHPPWDIGCDSMMTQSDMNSCSYKSYKIADSILTTMYDSLMLKLNKWKVAISERESDTTYCAHLIHLIRLSQDNFDAYKKSMMAIPAYQHKGGTVMPLIKNIYGLKLTISRIKALQMIRGDMAHFIR